MMPGRDRGEDFGLLLGSIPGHPTENKRREVMPVFTAYCFGSGGPVAEGECLPDWGTRGSDNRQAICCGSVNLARITAAVDRF